MGRTSNLVDLFNNAKINTMKKKFSTRIVKNKYSGLFNRKENVVLKKKLSKKSMS